MVIRILIVMKRKKDVGRFEAILHKRELLVRVLPGIGPLWKTLQGEEFDLLLMGRAVLPDPPGPFIESIRKLPDLPEVVVVLPEEDSRERSRLQRAGCFAVIPRDLEESAVDELLRRFTQHRRREVVLRFRPDRQEERFSLNDFVSDSPVMQVFLQTAVRLTRSDSSVLILGETGVGKERLARAIHAEGARSGNPFIAVNCSALPENLLESEMFGHEEGAFTGATRPRRGYFEIAHKGTIFLDEIGELPTHLQVKLLRVLEERRIQRVGAEHSIPVDVRIMAATNRDLELEMTEKRFRPDLYYRLAVVTLTLPPLRDRREDIPALVRSYLAHFRNQLNKEIVGIRPEAMAALHAYDWPGNVRELANAIEQAALLSPEAEIGLEYLPQRIGGRPLKEDEAISAWAARVAGWEESQESWLEKPLPVVRRKLTAEVERMYLRGLLTATGGKIGETARRSGIEERTLYNLMRKYGLRKENFRRSGRGRKQSLQEVGGKERGSGGDFTGEDSGEPSMS